MNKKQKDETLDVFVGAFHEVIVPVLEDLASKKDILEVKTDIKEVKTDLEEAINRLDNKVEMYTRRFVEVADIHGNKLDNHEKRIKHLETKRVLN